MERFYWKTLEGSGRRSASCVEEGYRSLPFPFEPVEAPLLALEQRWNVEQLLGYVGTWSAVQSLKKGGPRRRAGALRGGAPGGVGRSRAGAARALAAVTPARAGLAGADLSGGRPG